MRGRTTLYKWGGTTHSMGRNDRHPQVHFAHTTTDKRSSKLTLTAVLDATIGLYKMRLFSQCIKHAVYTTYLCLTNEFLCVNERVYYHCAPVQKSANVEKKLLYHTSGSGRCIYRHELHEGAD